MSKKSNITKKFLIKEYVVNKKSCQQIADRTGYTASAVWYKLAKYNIPTRKTCYSKTLTKKFLINEYIKNKKSMKTVAKIVGCSCSTINRYLIKYNIKIRTASESHIGKYLGKNHPNYKHGRYSKQYYCIDCGNKITPKAGFFGKGRCKLCYREFNRGKNHGAWKNGISFEPYPIEFNNILKASIRERDAHTCQICGILEKNHYRKLDIHHIDYNKNNLNSNNLITLCQSCHTKTNGDREIYIEYFNILMNIIW